MKSVITWIGIAVCFLGVGLLAAGCYRMLFAQKTATAFEINHPDMKTHILIATQGSSFKDAVVAGLIKELEKQPLYINIIDVSALPAINGAEWQAMVLVNTCQSNKLQPDVATYLARATALEKVILVTTSGSGRWQPEHLSVDSISSASRKARVQPLVTDIINRVNNILQTGVQAPRS